MQDPTTTLLLRLETAPGQLQLGRERERERGVSPILPSSPPFLPSLPPCLPQSVSISFRSGGGSRQTVGALSLWLPEREASVVKEKKAPGVSVPGGLFFALSLSPLIHLVAQTLRSGASGVCIF